MSDFPKIFFGIYKTYLKKTFWIGALVGRHFSLCPPKKANIAGSWGSYPTNTYSFHKRSTISWRFVNIFETLYKWKYWDNIQEKKNMQDPKFIQTIFVTWHQKNWGSRQIVWSFCFTLKSYRKSSVLFCSCDTIFLQ